MIYDASLESLLEKVWAGRRIGPAEALRLYQLPLEELGALADRRRQLARAQAHNGRGNQIVTYIVDRNVNYTNVCNVYCKFCAFYRTEKDTDSYVITYDEMDKKILSTLIDHYQGGPVGMNTLAIAIGEEPTTLSEVYEPFLIMQGFIKRTLRGREATHLAYQHLGRSLPSTILNQGDPS